MSTQNLARSRSQSAPGKPPGPPSTTQRRPLSESKWVIQLSRLALFVVVVGFLEYALSSGMISKLVMASPTDVARRLVEDTRDIVTGGQMLGHFLTTVGAIYLAFAVVVVLGIGLGALITQVTFINLVVYPFIIVLFAMPRIALAPLILIWFGFGLESKIVIGVMVGLFPTLVATIAGLNNTEESKLLLMRALGASKGETFRRVRMGDALPYIFAGLQTSIIVTAIGVIVGEFSGGLRGLGVLITIYDDSLDIAGVFSAILLLAAIGLFNYYGMQYIRRRVVFWVGDRGPV